MLLLCNYWQFVNRHWRNWACTRKFWVGFVEPQGDCKMDNLRQAPTIHQLRVGFHVEMVIDGLYLKRIGHRLASYSIFMSHPIQARTAQLFRKVEQGPLLTSGPQLDPRRWQTGISLLWLVSRKWYWHSRLLKNGFSCPSELISQAFVGLLLMSPQNCSPLLHWTGWLGNQILDGLQWFPWVVGLGKLWSVPHAHSCTHPQDFFHIGLACWKSLEFVLMDKLEMSNMNLGPIGVGQELPIIEQILWT